ncbi:MAG: SDR family oxidoreductase [Pseudomonadota bacterium]
MTHVAGKKVLITGGASGIGRLLARKLAGLGAEIIVWDINHSALDRVVEELRADTGRVHHGYLCDVSERTQVYDVATRVNAEVGRVDILVNNAGIVSGKRLLDLPDQQIERTLKVNTLALFWVTKAFLPQMVERNQGHIVNVSSAGGLLGSAKMSDYSASKFAAFGFDECLRMEMREQAPGVRTTVVCPYYIDTGMFAGVKTRFGFMLPILKEEYVAGKIVCAIQKDSPRLFMPRIVYTDFLLRGLLPVRVFDVVVDILGINKCMEDFVGRPAEPRGTPHLREVRA